MDLGVIYIPPNLDFSPLPIFRHNPYQMVYEHNHEQHFDYDPMFMDYWDERGRRGLFGRACLSVTVGGVEGTDGHR